jgi:hypothetical protein
VRYERLATSPDDVARELAAELAIGSDDLARALGAAHDRSVGRYRQQLDAAELAEIEAEAGSLLRELGYRR